MNSKLLLLILIFFSGNLFASGIQLIEVEELAKTTKSWDGSTLPEYKTGQPEITILKITVQPNVELPWHYHPVINAGVMIKGKLTVFTKDGKKLELSAGDTIVELVNKIHRGINNGSEPAEIIVFYADVVGTPITVKTK